MNGQVAEVAVRAIEDTLGLLTEADVVTRQEIIFGRPQLPSLRFDVVYSETQLPRGIVVLGGQMREYAFDPIVTRIITDRVYIEDEPVYAFEQWFPTQPIKINRVGSYVGEEAQNKGQLVFYPAQYRGSSAGGVLRVYDQVRLRVYYGDEMDIEDWQAPVIRRVRAVPGASSVQVSLQVSDPDSGVGTPSGVEDVWLTFSLDGEMWSSVPATRQSGDTWHVSLDLPGGGGASRLSFVVQAIDGAGNVAYSANKGGVYRGAESAVYLPLVLRSR